MKRKKKTAAAIMLSGMLAVIGSVNPSLMSDTFTSAFAVGKADEVLGFAGSKIGMGGPYNEASAFYGFYGRNVPWCAMFIYYCAASCGAPYAVPQSSYCDEQYGYAGGVQFFKNLSRWEYSYANGGSYYPERGDLAYFDWDYDGYADHVGYIEWADFSTIYTIEGNAEDMVKRKTYSVYDGNILGYGKSNFTAYDTIRSDTADYPEVTEPDAAEEYVPTDSHEESQPDTTSTYSPPEDVQYDDNEGGAAAEALCMEYYVTSPIGAWFRSAPEFFDSNRIGILDTGTPIQVYGIENNWAWASFTMDGGVSYISGYIHTSTINYTYNLSDSWASGSDSLYNYPTYSVTSPIGCWIRNTPEIAEGNQIDILDTGKTFEVISTDENGWLYVKADLYGNTTYGYVYSENADIAW